MAHKKLAHTIEWKSGRVLRGAAGRLCAAALSCAVLAVSIPGELSPAFFGSAGGESVRAASAHAAEEINGHTYLAESAGYRLYVNEEDLSLVVEDKATGAYMESAISYDDGNNNAIWIGAMTSAVVLTLINRTDDTVQADLVNDAVTKKVSYTANGFTAELYWTQYKLGFTLEVALTDDGLTARIPEASIKEESGQYFIGTIRMYPFMGTSYLDEREGYMLVPDGNGALIYLDDKEGRFSSGFSGTIYGTDIGFEDSRPETLLWDKYNMLTGAEKVLAPVYGIAHTDEKLAYLAIVEDGAERASIDVVPNGVSVDYNRAYARFVLRRLYSQPTSNNTTSGALHVYEEDRSHSDLQVRFLFLSGEQASYAGMAAAYRSYLLANGEILQGDTSYRTRIDFMGTERKSWLLSTKAVPMTTVDDIEEIYEDLETLGVTNILTVYKGWQKGGLYDLPISAYKADSKIGGTSDLTKLIKSSAEQGILIYLYDNALLINPDEHNASFHVIKKINKTRYEKKTYQDVYESMMYLTPARSRALLRQFVKGYTKKGVSNLCVAGISSMLYTYIYSGEKYSRFETAAVYEEILDELGESTNLILEQPFACYWKNTGAFLDMPLYTSSYIVEDESIPFLSLVLKGVMPMYADYTNFEANKQEFLLKMVESGAYPSFYITKEDSSELIYTNSSDVYSSQYDTYRNMISEYNAELSALAERVSGAVVTGHTIYDHAVRLVEYSNGVRIYLNYSEDAQTVDGITLEAMSYVVK